MKKRNYGNVLVVFYVAFLGILTMEIAADKVKVKEQGKEEVMEINMYEMDSEVEWGVRTMDTAVSERRTIVEQGVEREMAYDLSDEDYQTLLKIVEAEAGCEDENGKLLVANVVLNRVDSGRFPQTVQGVVYQADGGKVQFTPAYNGRINSVKVTEETKSAVNKALYGEDISGGALYFVSTAAAGAEKSSWFYSHLTHVLDYGRHSFFR